MVGQLSRRGARRIAGASAGVLLAKSFYLSNEVYLAMLARGYQGENHSLDDFVMSKPDWLALTGFTAVATLAFFLGR